MDKENVEVRKETVDPIYVHERKNNGVPRKRKRKRIAKVCVIGAITVFYLYF